MTVDVGESNINKLPKYYSLKTLLAGGDVNRRTIYRNDGKCGIQVAVFNQEMRNWDNDLEMELRKCLKALNEG